MIYNTKKLNTNFRPQRRLDLTLRLKHVLGVENFFPFGINAILVPGHVLKSDIINIISEIASLKCRCNIVLPNTKKSNLG